MPDEQALKRYHQGSIEKSPGLFSQLTGVINLSPLQQETKPIQNKGAFLDSTTSVQCQQSD